MIKIMKTKTQLSDFNFIQSGYGHYKVLYKSCNGKQWIAIVSDMTIIDATKNADEPKRKDLERLKQICKNRL